MLLLVVYNIVAAATTTVANPRDNIMDEIEDEKRKMKITSCNNIIIM
jgi:hypothetical protein